MRRSNAFLMVSIAKTGAALSLWQEARRAGPKMDLRLLTTGRRRPD
jgi:hypothetical protein